MSTSFSKAYLPINFSAILTALWALRLFFSAGSDSCILNLGGNVAKERNREICKTVNSRYSYKLRVDTLEQNQNCALISNFGC